MQVSILDVTPRDGLQDASGFVPVAIKRALLTGLREAGYRRVEATSFVHPRWVPMLPDAEEVMAHAATLPGVEWIALVPNLRGFERAQRVGVRSLTVVCSASESHNRANLNRSRSDTLAELKEVVRGAHGRGARVRGAVSTTFRCAFEGRVAVAEAVRVVEAYLAMGIDELSVADTVGWASAEDVEETLGAILRVTGSVPVSVHFHDRDGHALANVAVALGLGVTRFECGIGGLGGCPFAPGAGANLSVEHLVPFLQAEGLDPGIDLDRVRQLRNMLDACIAEGLAPPA
jgi:hydroxymethylglutaryl-CoA lyase